MLVLVLRMLQEVIHTLSHLRTFSLHFEISECTHVCIHLHPATCPPSESLLRVNEYSWVKYYMRIWVIFWQVEQHLYFSSLARPLFHHPVLTEGHCFLIKIS